MFVSKSYKLILDNMTIWNILLVVPKTYAILCCIGHHVVVVIRTDDPLKHSIEAVSEIARFSPPAPPPKIVSYELKPPKYGLTWLVYLLTLESIDLNMAAYWNDMLTYIKCLSVSLRNSFRYLSEAL